MSEQQRQDDLHARIDTHAMEVNIHGYFHDHVADQPNPEAYMRSLVPDPAKDAELTALLDTLDTARTTFASDQTLLELRRKRDKHLASTDFTQVADSPLTAQEVADYASYRTYLRDLPAQDPLPADVDDFTAWLAKQ